MFSASIWQGLPARYKAGVLAVAVLGLVGCRTNAPESGAASQAVPIRVAAAGVLPGLVLSGAPFGFQSLLGVIVLVGIVVNNAIVLIDVVDQRLASGMNIDAAVSEAVLRRTRPILLTTATTIAGLLPLALSSSTLWPPMAWATISGLLASTVLTLLVVPAVCRLALRPRQQPTGEVTQVPADIFK